MNSSQTKWLLIGIGGAFVCMAAFSGFVYFIGVVVLDLRDTEDLDWGASSASSNSNDHGVDAPAEWQRWAQEQRDAAERNKPENDRLYALYEVVSPYREIRRRLHLEGDYDYAEAELKKHFATISDPLAATSYSKTIEQLSEFTYDTDPEDLRSIVRKWAEAYPDSHFAWLVRGHQAINYAWYWRGSGWSSTVSDKGWENFGKAIDEAAECFDKAYDLEPNDPEIGNGMITVCMAQSRPREEMEKHFERAIKVAPAHLGAYSAKFEYLRPAWSGSWPEYREFLDSIDAKVAEQGHPVLRIAERRARDDMEKELDRDGKTSDQRNKESAREWLEIRKAMAERWPDDVLTRGLYAKELMRSKNMFGAQKEYDWIGNRYPMDVGQTIAVYHQQRFQAYMMVSMNLRGQARLDMCNRALEFDPGYFVNHQALGLAYDANGDIDLAEGAILRAMELNPEFGGTHIQLARLYQKTNRLNEALDEVRKAKKLHLEDAMWPAVDKLERELEQAVKQSGSSGSEQ